jgi:hypothetical protein
MRKRELQAWKKCPELRRVLEQLEELETLERPWSDQFSEAEQVRLWEYVDDRVDIRAMEERGESQARILFAIHPYMLLLIFAGRPDEQERADYFKWIKAATERARVARVIGRSLTPDAPAQPDPQAPPGSSCIHTGQVGLCETCSDFLGRISPIITCGARKPRQEDVATALGYTPRHLRRLCEGLGYRSWSAFYAAVRLGRLSPET